MGSSFELRQDITEELGIEIRSNEIRKNITLCNSEGDFSDVEIQY